MFAKFTRRKSGSDGGAVVYLAAAHVLKVEPIDDVPAVPAGDDAPERPAIKRSRVELVGGGVEFVEGDAASVRDAIVEASASRIVTAFMSEAADTLKGNKAAAGKGKRSKV